MSIKGQWHRPADKDKFNDNFDRIFGKDKQQERMIELPILAEVPFRSELLGKIMDTK